MAEDLHPPPRQPAIGEIRNGAKLKFKYKISIKLHLDFLKALHPNAKFAKIKCCLLALSGFNETITCNNAF